MFDKLTPSSVFQNKKPVRQNGSLARHQRWNSSVASLNAVAFATVGLVAAAMLPQTAFAQDQWDGFFLGVHAGAVDSYSTIRDEDGTIFDADGGTLFTNDMTGLIGIHGGYNWQHGNRVLGIEADYSWTTAGRSRFFDTTDHTASFDLDGFGSVRGRAGVAVDNTLIYVLGGVGFVDATASGSDSFPNQVVEQSNPVAFVVGAGAEFKFRNNLSARAEFLQYLWGDQTTFCIDCVGDGPQIFSGGMSVFRAGLTYHLGQTADKVDLSSDNVWSGLYFGGHVGAVDTSTRVQDEDSTVLDTEGISIFTNNLDAAGGVHIGYNHAVGSAILGVEADYTFTDSGFSRFYDGGDHFLSSQIDGIASLRARLGLAAGNAHAYVTGGVAHIDGEIVASDDLTNPSQTVQFNDFTALVLGVGAEVKATDKVSIRGEYLYYALDEKGIICGACTSPDQPVLADGQIHTFRIGASYHLNGNAVNTAMPDATNWSGLYAGGHVSFVDTLTGIRDEDGTLFDDEGATSFTSSQDAGGGIYAGYNHQWGNAVAGIEVDYTFTDSGQARFFDGTDQFKSSQIDGFGSVRGRIGLAAGDALFYATGGIGFVDAEVVGYDRLPTEVVEYKDFTALVAGVGTEFKVWDKVAFRAEYLYYGLNEKEDTCIGCTQAPAYADGEIHTFRSGITFLLN